MKTPNELFEMFAVIATEVNLNTAEAMYDCGVDFVDISVYDREMDAIICIRN